MITTHECLALLQLMPTPTRATHTITTSACIAAVYNVVPADVDTNALSTSETMDNELEFLLSVEGGGAPGRPGRRRAGAARRHS